MKKYSLELICVLFYFCFVEVSPWTVDCTDQGYCTVFLSTTNSYIYLQPGVLPVIPEKNLIPLKNSTNSIPIPISVKETPNGISVKGLLKGSDVYECADGLSECFQGCCLNGQCTDPTFVCSTHENNIKEMLLIIGVLFIIFIIAYWTVYYIFGHYYNLKPLENTTDNIYSKFNAKLSSSNSEKCPTPSDPLKQNSNPLERYMSREREDFNEVDINMDRKNDFNSNFELKNKMLNNRYENNTQEQYDSNKVIEFNNLKHYHNNVNNINNTNYTVINKLSEESKKNSKDEFQTTNKIHNFSIGTETEMRTLKKRKTGDKVFNRPKIPPVVQFSTIDNEEFEEKKLDHIENNTSKIISNPDIKEKINENVKEEIKINNNKPQYFNVLTGNLNVIIEESSVTQSEMTNRNRESAINVTETNNKFQNSDVKENNSNLKIPITESLEIKKIKENEETKPKANHNFFERMFG